MGEKLETGSLGQEVVGEHIKSCEQGVEVGWHAASFTCHDLHQLLAKADTSQILAA